MNTPIIRIGFGFSLALGVLACNSDDGDDGNQPPLDASFRAGYMPADACHGNANEAACGADPACQWNVLAAECPDGATCPTGLCETQDRCRDHLQQNDCLGDDDSNCAWADRDRLCLGDRDCRDEGGYCFGVGAGTGDCACLCPAYCADGDACECECDCTMQQAREQERNRGGSCACACPPCEPGTICEPCECACEGPTGAGEGGCVEGGTCLCQCEQCDNPPCADCDCACNLYEGPGPNGVPTCTCPACPEGESCPACNCFGDGNGTGGGSGTGGDTDGGGGSCESHTRAMDCNAEADCLWLRLGEGCADGSCHLGSCIDAASAPGDCLCLCEECQDGESCNNCGCDCSGNMNCAPA